MIMHKKPFAALPRRSGFTLVEMLVSAAVSIVLMVIITGAFQQGLAMFSKLRAQGQLQERARMATMTLRDDLSWQHFLPQSSQTNSPAFGDSKLYWVAGQDLTKADTVWVPPDDGFFRIANGQEQFPPPEYLARPLAQRPPFVLDGTDSVGLAYTRATGHSLHFTVLRQGSGPEHMFRVQEQRMIQNPAGPLPPFIQFPSQTGFTNSYIDPKDYREPGVFSTRWAEVAYFLVASGDTANGVPLFNLYRRHKLLLPPPTAPNVFAGGGPQVATNYITPFPPGQGNPPPNVEISTRTQLPNNVGQFVPNTQNYNRSGSVTQPRNRWGMLPAHQQNNPALNPTTYRNLAGLFRSSPVGAPVGPPPVVVGTRYFTMAEELALPPTSNANDGRGANDLLLQDVISFEVKAFWTGGPAPLTSYTVPIAGGGTMTIANTDYPFDYIPLSTTNLVLANRGMRVFDTWSKSAASPYSWVDPAAPPISAGKPMWQRTDPVGNPNFTAARLPLRINVKAIQIKIRLYDFKTEQTRQITIIQDV